MLYFSLRTELFGDTRNAAVADTHSALSLLYIRYFCVAIDKKIYILYIICYRQEAEVCIIFNIF